MAYYDVTVTTTTVDGDHAQTLPGPIKAASVERALASLHPGEETYPYQQKLSTTIRHLTHDGERIWLVALTQADLDTQPTFITFTVRKLGI